MNSYLKKKPKSSVERVWTKAKVYRGSLSTFFLVWRHPTVKFRWLDPDPRRVAGSPEARDHLPARRMEADGCRSQDANAIWYFLWECHQGSGHIGNGVCVCVSLGGLVMCVLFVCARLDKPWGSVWKWRNDQIKVKRWWAWPHPTTIFKSWINHETKSNRKHHPLSSLSPLLWSELFASAISNPMGHGFTFQIPTGQWTFEDLSQQRLKVAKLKRRLSHEIHARECRQVILPHDILPRNLKKNISPPTCFFWKYGAPPKSHGWKSHFPNKNQPGPGGPRACGVCKPSSLASFNAISKRWVFRDKVDMSSSWQMVPGWETSGAGNSLSQGFHDGWILGMRLLF